MSSSRLTVMRVYICCATRRVVDTIVYTSFFLTYLRKLGDHLGVAVFLILLTLYDSNEMYDIFLDGSLW